MTCNDNFQVSLRISTRQTRKMTRWFFVMIMCLLVGQPFEQWKLFAFRNMLRRANKAIFFSVSWDEKKRRWNNALHRECIVCDLCEFAVRPNKIAEANGMRCQTCNETRVDWRKVMCFWAAGEARQFDSVFFVLLSPAVIVAYTSLECFSYCLCLTFVVCNPNIMFVLCGCCCSCFFCFVSFFSVVFSWLIDANNDFLWMSFIHTKHHTVVDEITAHSFCWVWNASTGCELRERDREKEKICRHDFSLFHRCLLVSQQLNTVRGHMRL